MHTSAQVHQNSELFPHKHTMANTSNRPPVGKWQIYCKVVVGGCGGEGGWGGGAGG